MKNGKRVFETAVHGIFLVLGLITVACVLLITVYLVISGIPAIREIGLVPFLFGEKWASTGGRAVLRYPALYSDQHLRNGRGHPAGRAHRLFCGCLSGQGRFAPGEGRDAVRCEPAGGHSVGVYGLVGMLCWCPASASCSMCRTVPVCWRP